MEAHFPQSKVNIRTETYDDRLVVFIANGNTVPIQATVSLGLSNLESVLGNPISISLQAREERFLTILIVQDLAENYRITYRISL